MTLLFFVELPPFRRYLDSLTEGQDVLKAIQLVLSEEPESGAVIEGTGGLRKIRVAAQGQGKRGGYRITYLFVPAKKTVYLVVLYAKNEKENLSKGEKNELKMMVEILKQEKLK